MALDYERIRQENKTRYGTDIGRIGKMLFTDTYADRTHFIFELLQNAEDAIARRGTEWDGSRVVSFCLTQEELQVSHFGDPFNVEDVRGICGIAESTKTDNFTEIGRFGIGFKSVYAFTDRPEIHSGSEDFAVDNFVWPVVETSIHDRHPDETVILLPFRSDEESSYREIADGLNDLGIRALLFLRQIEEIRWSVDDGNSGHYLREEAPVDDDVRRVTVIGQVEGEEEVCEEWLIFSRQVNDGRMPPGNVEIAFWLDDQAIKPVHDSRLVAFFPTTLETHFGFLMQGPYRTTPNRENVPAHDVWNQCLVNETAILLPETLRWLRDENHLDTEVLRCLPLSSYSLYMEAARNSMFSALSDATRKALASEPLLPRLDGGYVSATDSLLGRTEAIRQLFSPDQLSALYGKDKIWLSGEITQDRAPDVRNYLMNELDVEEIDPEMIVRRLSRTFLESQPDSWILKLYEFLSGQPAIMRMLTGRRYRPYNVPLVRLEDGSHVTPEVNGQPRAFLPGEGKTDFPTVRLAVCVTDDALGFLRSLGLKEPDLVDDVIRNVLPKYQKKGIKVGDAHYEADVGRILRAFATDSNTQRQRLVTELQKSMFVRSKDARTATKWWVSPGSVYLATSGMKELFDGVEGVRIVDDSYECLRGEKIRELLEECGTTHYLKPINIDTEFSHTERREMRRNAGNEDFTIGSEKVKDHSLRGLNELLDALPQFESDLRLKKAKLLWKALLELEDRRGASVFSGTYNWRYHTPKKTAFDAAFVRKLNKIAWVTKKVGELEPAKAIIFDELGWHESSFLRSKIQFKPPIVQELAREAGIEPEVLDLIKEHGITIDGLREWLGVNEEPIEDDVTITSEPSESEIDRRGCVGRVGGRHIDDKISQGAIDPKSGLSPSELVPEEVDEPSEPFVKVFFEVQTTTPSDAPDHPVTISEGGPLTEESARQHTQQSGQFGRSGSSVRKLTTRWEPTEAAKDLADGFRNMVHGDYWKRCQVCGKTFGMSNGESQVFVVHVVPPSADSRTDHFGDLLGLCGWHYALIRYGKWALLNPETDEPFKDPESMSDFVLNASEEIDDGNIYIPIPVRFSNVYQEWSSELDAKPAAIRYSIPHWKYLCELLKT